jgi:heptosyltransferase-3
MRALAPGRRRICYRWRAMPIPPQDAVPLSDVGSILVTKLQHHGDVLLASPVFTVLKRAAPHATIDALVYAETAPLLAHHPAISQIHTVDRTGRDRGALSRLAAEISLMRRLRARRYDLLLHLTGHPRGWNVAWMLRPRYAVTAERTRPDRRWHRQFTHFYRSPKPGTRHAVELNLDALRRIGVYPEPAEKKLVLIAGAEAEAAAERFLQQHALARGEFVQAHPGSRWLFKCWPAERMAALFDRIVADGRRIVVTGAADARERELIDATLTACGAATREAVVDCAGRTTLAELAALSARARAFVGVDTAAMHIAAAMGTPVLALFGPSDEHVWGPWNVAHRVVAADDARCRPCNIDGCGGGKVSECLTTLAVERVHAAFVALLADTSPAPPRQPVLRLFAKESLAAPVVPNASAHE